LKVINTLLIAVDFTNGTGRVEIKHTEHGKKISLIAVEQFQWNLNKMNMIRV
jgi:hypothetical protein